MNGAVVAAWLAEVGLVTWRDFKAGRTVLGLPPPSDYAATFVVFGGMLAVSSIDGAGGFAAAFSWAIVLASVLNLYDPTFNKGKNPLAPPGPQTTSTTSPALPGQPIVANTQGG